MGLISDYFSFDQKGPDVELVRCFDSFKEQLDDVLGRGEMLSYLSERMGTSTAISENLTIASKDS